MAILMLGERRMNEEEQAHIFICLVEGEKAFKKQLKGAESLKLPTDPIEASLALNQSLRRMYNPNATEGGDDTGDDDQLDFTVEGATETGGSTRQRIQTPPAQTDEQIRDSLMQIGFVLPLNAIRALTKDERLAIESYIGQVIAAGTIGGAVPDEPTPVASMAVPYAKIHERITLGPYGVVDKTDGDGHCWAIVHGESGDVKDSFADPIDAEFFCAQFNLERLRNSEMSEEEVSRWVETGPWGVEGTEDGGYEIVAGTEKEKCASVEDAFGRAARYNRSIAQRGAGESWTEPKPSVVDGDALQELEAAKEAGEAQAEAEPVSAE